MHRALEPRPAHRLLLPCTVVVRATDEGTTFDALDAQVTVNVPGNQALRPIADEAAAKINAALGDLRA